MFMKSEKLEQHIAGRHTNLFMNANFKNVAKEVFIFCSNRIWAAKGL